MLTDDCRAGRLKAAGSCRQVGRGAAATVVMAAAAAAAASDEGGEGAGQQQRGGAGWGQLRFLGRRFMVHENFNIALKNIF